MTLVGRRLDRELLSVVDTASNCATLYLMAGCPTAAINENPKLHEVDVTAAGWQAAFCCVVDESRRFAK
jgi:hypothetical protein